MSSPWVKARLDFEKEILSSAKGINNNAQRLLVNATSRFLDAVQELSTKNGDNPNMGVIPYYTGNLHDSIATSVSMSGRIIRANYMPKQATKAQSAPGRKKIWGALEAERAVRSYTPRRTGLAATLFVAVPYAEGANQQSSHPHYFEWLQSAFENEMISAVNALPYVVGQKGAKVPEYQAKRI